MSGSAELAGGEGPGRQGGPGRAGGPARPVIEGFPGGFGAGHMGNEIMMGRRSPAWQNPAWSWRERSFGLGGRELLVTGGCSVHGSPQIPSGLRSF